MQVFLEATSTRSDQVSIALMSVGLKPKMMAYEEVIKSTEASKQSLLSEFFSGY